MGIKSVILFFSFIIFTLIIITFSFRNIWLFIKKYFLRKSVYIVFTLIGIFLYFLNFFIVKNKGVWGFDDTARFIIGIIRPAGILFNFFWFLITGIMIVVKSINYFNNNFNDILLLKIFGIILGILGGVILILLAFPIILYLYMGLYGA